MKKKEYISQVKELIKEGNPSDAIQLLATEYSEDDEIKNEILIISARLEKLEKAERRGIIDDKDANLNSNQINESILKICNKIENPNIVKFKKTDSEFSDIDKPKNKLSWIIISIIGGGVAFLLSYYFLDFEHLKIALGIGVLSILILIIYNPKRRFLRAFYYVISIFIFSNKFFLEFAFDNIHGGISNLTAWENAVLLFVAGISLTLDYFENRDKKLNSKFEFNPMFTIKKIKNFVIGSGNNIDSKIDS